MELTFIQQSIAFLYSIILGLFLGAVYGVFKFTATACSFGKVSIIVSDIIFMLIVFLSIFFFSIAYLFGYIRVYIFVGTLIGFLCYRMTIGHILSKIYCPVISVVKKISRNIHVKFKKIAKKLLKIPYKILYNDSDKRRIFGNKSICKVSYKRVMDSNEEKTATSKRSSGGSESRK